MAREVTMPSSISLMLGRIFVERDHMDCNQVCQGIRQFLGNTLSNIFGGVLICGAVLLALKLIGSLIASAFNEIRGTITDICNSRLGRRLGRRAHLLYLLPICAFTLCYVEFSPFVRELWWLEELLYWTGFVTGAMSVANIATGYPSPKQI